MTHLAIVKRGRVGATSLIALMMIAASGADAQMTPAAQAAYGCGPVPKSRLSLPSMGGLKYAVDGKKGKFICQIAAQDLKPEPMSDPTLKAGFSAMNRVEYQDRRLNMVETRKSLQQMLDRISAQWPYPKPEGVTIHIAGTGAYRAEALADNSIKVHLGLLVGATSEDEVAFILAHEYAHLALKHLRRNGEIAKRNAMLSKLSDAYYFASKVSKQEWSETSQTLTISSQDKIKLVSAQQRAGDSSAQIRMMLDVAVYPVVAKANEDEADAIGFDLAAKAGYDAEGGAGKAFQTIAEVEGRERKLFEALGDSVETSLMEVSAVQAKSLQASAATDANFLQKINLSSVWNDVNRTVRKGVTETVKKAMKAQHRDPEVRLKELTEYIEEAYGGTDLPKPADWLTVVKGRKEFKDAETAVLAVDESIAARQAGDIKAARRAVNRAALTPYKTSTMVQNELARVLTAEGNLKLASTIFTAAHKLPFQSGAAYQDHVDILVTLKSWPQAKAVADMGSNAFNDRKPFLPTYVLVGFTTGQQDAAVADLNLCIDTEIPQLKMACVNNAPVPGQPAFARLSATNQEAVLRAHARLNNKSAIEQGATTVKGWFGGLGT
ncbi:M48 family metalloprotease [Asticcacaulis sp. SL142]|uniref:M48 family metalloprotease n=1 Tax=Asticcacaulis sp. SL142 TaxID=2995155 RepID=UPI00226CA44D|nr:M48 family metalloprotease [Asticcacaulis sp. SL142]WAC47226.1 M48 family metalloprotease [Asticcacaulis sp. SL142]